MRINPINFTTFGMSENGRQEFFKKVSQDTGENLAGVNKIFYRTKPQDLGAAKMFYDKTHAAGKLPPEYAAHVASFATAEDVEAMIKFHDHADADLTNGWLTHFLLGISEKNVGTRIKIFDAVVKTNGDFPSYAAMRNLFSHTENLLKFDKEPHADMKQTKQDIELVKEYIAPEELLNLGIDTEKISKLNKTVRPFIEPVAVSDSARADFFKGFVNNEYAIKTGDFEALVPAILAGIPEFANVIGRRQHETHDHTVDVHTFKVLQECLNNPDYQKLSQPNKTILKIAVLLHDMTKEEGVVDKDHPITGALQARDLLKDFKISQGMKDKIIEHVRNHHWLADYNTYKIRAQEVAAMFRTPQDYLMAKIFAEADLKSVNDYFYEKYGGALSPERQQPIVDAMQKVQNTGIILPTTPIVKGGYRVIDFTKINKDDDMGEYGFVNGTRKEDTRFLVHFLPEEKTEELLDTNVKLSDVTTRGVLSPSLLTAYHRVPAGNRHFGLVVDAGNENISDAYPYFIGSGYEKSFKTFVELLNDQRQKSGTHRFVSDNIIKALEEKYNMFNYRELYEQLLPKKYISQIDEVKVGEKTISKDDLKKALVSAQEALCKENTPNEVVVYNPKIKAIACKTNSADEVPEYITNFAKQHNLPVLLIGNY